MATRKDINTFISGKGFPSFDADFGWVYEDVDTGKRYRQSTSPRGHLWKLLKMSPEIEAEIVSRIEEGNFLTSVSVDGTTIIGDGTPSSPLSAPGIGGETLAQTLAIGNLTGGNDIIISDGDVITGSGGQIHQDFGNDLAWVLTTDGGGFGTPYAVVNTTTIELASLGGGGLLLVAGSTSLAHSTLLNLISPQVDVSSLAGFGDGFVLVDNAGTITTGVVSVDGVSITGDGTVANPLVATGAGFVPYAGATADVTLGLFTLQADSILINDSANDHTLNLISGEDLTANHILRIIVNDADRILTIAANATISNTNTGDQNLFATIAAPAGTNPVADSTTDTLTLANGTGISITGDSVTDTITIASTITQYTDELAQDAIGAMVDTTLTYVDGTPLLQRSALTGHITASAGSNTTALHSSAITDQSTVTVASGDLLLIADVSDANNLKKVLASDFLSGSGANTALSNLAAVAINADLDPGIDNVREIGNPSFQWNALHLGDTGFILWNGSMGSIQVIGSEMFFANSTDYFFDANINLPEGGAIDWDGGDAVLTQTGNNIAWTGIIGYSVGTSTALTLGTIEVGAASDTTISRTAAGKIAVEGKGLITTILTTTYITGTAATHNFTAGMVYCEVWCTGQGGGGGGARASDGSSIAGASGGGAGGTAYILYNATEAGASATYTVGTAGGGGGANTGGNGTAGSNSTFDPAGTGATLTGTGGALGTGHDNATPAVTARAGGLGGVPTGGSLNINGGAGGAGSTGSITTVPPLGGHGGASLWGGGGGLTSASAASTVAGIEGTAYGSGGSGATAINSSAGSLGGNGAVGVIMIIEYIQ